jgi:cytochrome c biogenesis protein CcdA
MSHCHEEPAVAAATAAGTAAPPAGLATPVGRLEGVTAMLAGYPRAAVLLVAALGSVALASATWIAMSPFDAAAFGGITVPIVLGAGVADGLNPCSFALLVLFATYTLTLVNAVASDGSPTLEARRRLLAAGSLYVGAVWITYFVIGLGLFTFLGWLGRWMLKDVFLPGVGPSMAAPGGTSRRMHQAIERGGLAGMLIAGVLVGICTVPCSGAIYLDIVAVLNASGGGATGLALLALYNLAYIAPLVAVLAVVSDRRVLGRVGRWGRSSSPWIKVGLALAVVAMSFGLLISL